MGDHVEGDKGSAGNQGVDYHLTYHSCVVSIHGRHEVHHVLGVKKINQAAASSAERALDSQAVSPLQVLVV